jgi:hypothetical protein
MMIKIKNLEERKERFLRDNLPIRMGGLAANLARIKSFSESDDNSAAVYLLLEESKYYIEWAGREMDAEKAAPLINLQRKISGWQQRWDSVWSDKDRRKMLAKVAERWSLEILRKSGLLDQ